MLPSQYEQCYQPKSNWGIFFTMLCAVDEETFDKYFKCCVDLAKELPYERDLKPVLEDNKDVFAAVAKYEYHLSLEINDVVRHMVWLVTLLFVLNKDVKKVYEFISFLRKKFRVHYIEDAEYFMGSLCETLYMEWEKHLKSNGVMLEEQE